MCLRDSTKVTLGGVGVTFVRMRCGDVNWAYWLLFVGNVTAKIDGKTT